MPRACPSHCPCLMMITDGTTVEGRDGLRIVVRVGALELTRDGQTRVEHWSTDGSLVARVESLRAPLVPSDATELPYWRTVGSSGLDELEPAVSF